MDLPLHDVGALTRILESLPEFVLVVDRDGIIRYINRVEPGFDRDQVIGSSAESFMLSDSKSDFTVRLGRVFATGLCPECYGREMEGLERKGGRGHDTG